MIKFTLRLIEDEKKKLDIKSDELGKSKNEVLRYLINNKLEDTKKEFDLLNELDNNYKELGFEIEGLQKRGAYLREGIFLDVYLMGKLID